MPDDEKRMIESYEVKTAIHIGGKEIIFAEDLKSDMPYMVCDCTWNNPFGAEEYHHALGSDKYVEIMGEFSQRLATEVKALAAEQEQLMAQGVSLKPLTYADCIPRSEHMDFHGQVVVLKPEKLAAFARTPENQLYLAIDGNGARADARGNAVYCYDLYTGEHCRRERYNVAGIIDPAKIPAWAVEKLASLEVKLQAEKPSIMEQLAKAKQAASRERPANPKDTKKTGPEL